MKIAVIGTGYVGLVSGVCLADKGHQVTCVDILEDKVTLINSGTSPIYESGLDELLQNNIGKRLKASTNLYEAIMDAEISIIAVGTPFDGNEIDLKYIRLVSQQIGEVLKDKDDYHVVTVKSTVVPGTTDGVVLPILESASGKTAGDAFGVAMNPEFLREGNAIEDFMNPDRIVLGGIDNKSITLLNKCYAPFSNVDILKTNPRTAEMIKYTANSLLATLISFSNEIANLCTAIGHIDAEEVMNGVKLDRRFSPILDNGVRISPDSNTYLEAGCGFGGSCFPKDVKALVSHGQKYERPMAILESVIAVNKVQPEEMLRMSHKHFKNLDNVNVAILGLAFKPATDDMRESPAIPVIQYLYKQGANIKTFDPIAKNQARLIFKQEKLQYEDTVESAVDGANLILIMTRWSEINELPSILKKTKSDAIVIDGRRMLEPGSVSNYEGIGL